MGCVSGRRPVTGAFLVAIVVDAALTHFPNSTTVREHTYTDFRRWLFAQYRATWAHLPQAERLQEGLRNVYRMRAVHGHPWWEQVGAEIEAALERMGAQ